MPIFGEYESVGDPLSETPSRERITTVWRVRKAGDKSNAALVVKHVVPVRSNRSKASSQDDLLDADPGIEFLDCLKSIKKLPHKAAKSFAPILDFGMADAGVWYATNHCRRGSLKTYINLRGIVDSGALRNVIGSVVAGCIALKQSTGRCHGNIKPANVLLAGDTRALRKTPLLLADPMPISAARVSNLGSNDQELVKSIFEANDLRSIGELILQLVEGRLVGSGFDYNYPIATSPAWQRLGKDEKLWRDWCNRLVDPHLTLETTNLELLAREFRPSSKSPVLFYSLLALVLCGGVSGGVYYHLAGRFDRHLSAAKISMESQRWLEARSEIGVALQLRPRDPAALAVEARIKDTITQQIKQLMEAASHQVESDHLDKADECLRQANALTGTPSPEAQQVAERINRRKTELAQLNDFNGLMREASSALGNNNFSQAADMARRALALQPQNLELQKILTQAKEGIARAEAAQQVEQKYGEAMKQGEAALKAGKYLEAAGYAKTAGDLKYPGDNGRAGDLQNRIELANKQAAADKQLQAEKEKKYKTAMEAAQKANQDKEYGKAMNLAQEALRNRPDDSDAKELYQRAARAEAAQQVEQKYGEAMKQGEAALKAKKYLEASGYAKTAGDLKYPSDNGRAGDLQNRIELANKQAAADKQLQAEKEKKYEEAMEKARGAKSNGEYSKAMELTREALKNRPDDAAATTLYIEAGRAEAAQQVEQKYGEAMKQGEAAFKAGKYLEAAGYAKTAGDLKYPGDNSRVGDLQNRISMAEAEKKYRESLAAATNDFSRGLYSDAKAKLVAAKKMGVGTRDADAYTKDFVQPELDFADLMEQARTKSASNLDQALEAVQNALKIKPRDSVALVKQSELQAKLGQLQKRQELDNRLRDLMEIFELKAKPNGAIVLQTGKDRAKRDANDLDTQARNGGLQQEIEALKDDYKKAGIDISGERQDAIDRLIKKIPEFIR